MRGSGSEQGIEVVDGVHDCMTTNTRTSKGMAAQVTGMAGVQQQGHGTGMARGSGQVVHGRGKGGTGHGTGACPGHNAKHGGP